MKVLEIKEDERGKLIEVLKIPGAGQLSYVAVNPGMTRGNHYHKRKRESFCVIGGEAIITLRNRKNNEAREFNVSGGSPAIVEIEADWTHNIKNIGKDILSLLIWVNEIFDPNDPDTYAEEV